MTAKQSAQSAAIASFLLLIDSNDKLARSVPAFFRHTESLRDLLGQAKSADAQSKQSTTGITKDKLSTKAQLQAKMVKLTALVSGFAADTGDSILAKRVNGFTNAYNRTRQHEIVDLCQDVLDKIKPHLPHLKDYAVTADMLKEAQDLMDTYDGKVPVTRSKAKEKKVSTSDRAAMFTKMTDLINNKILKVAVAFQDSESSFYKKMTEMLVADATSTPPTQIKLVFENKTGLRSMNTVISAVSSNTNIAQTPNDKGEILLKFQKGGRFDINVTIEGGEPIHLNQVLAKKNKTTKLVVSI